MALTVDLVSLAGTPRGNVIFVHGLGGDPKRTWQRGDDPRWFWPAWLGQSFPDLNVWSVGYDAAPSGWLGYAMPVQDRALSVLDRLCTTELGSAPIVFVAHSLGGLVVEQLLRAANDHSDKKEWQRILRSTKGIVLLGTPHAGSLWATLARCLPRVVWPSDAIADLVADNPTVRDLTRWFRANVGRLRIKTKVYLEGRRTIVARLVSPSGDIGLPESPGVLTDAHHLDICKPPSPTDPVYEGTCAFVRDVLQVEKRGTRDLPSGAPPSEPRSRRRSIIVGVVAVGIVGFVLFSRGGCGDFDCPLDFGRPATLSGGPEPGHSCGTDGVQIIALEPSGWWKFRKSNPPPVDRGDIQGLVTGRPNRNVGIAFEAAPLCRGQSIKDSDGYIDWGDGSARDPLGEILRGCRTHRYPYVGNFIIRVRMSLVCYDYGGPPEQRGEQRCVANGSITARIS